MDFTKVNLELWKQMQDEFSKAAGFAITAIDLKGNEICVSGKHTFFHELLRKKNAELIASRRLAVMPDAKSKSNLLFSYYPGIYAVAYPLMVFDQFFGLLIVDGIKKQENIDFSKLAALLKVDKDDLDYAYGEMHVIEANLLQEKLNTVSIFSRTIPQLAYSKYHEDRRIKELTILSELIKMINSSLDLEAVLKYIMNFMIINLHAKDCSIIVDSEDGEKRYCMKDESKNLHVIEKAVRNKVNEVKSYVLVRDIDKKFDFDIPEGYNSLVSFPLKLKDDIVGLLNVYGNSVLELDHYDLEFLSTVSNQAAIAVINAAKFEEVKILAVVDKLTGVYNRRYFMTLLESQLEKKEPVSLILTDIDSFGNYNNTHGHPQGDELLKDLAGLLKQNIRQNDVVGRYGGEEFIILLPGLKTSEAAEMTKRIKEAVEHHSFPGGEQQPFGKVTISLGLVSSLEEDVSSRELIKEADEALYKAKKGGKNRFVHTVMIRKNLKADTVVTHK